MERQITGLRENPSVGVKIVRAFSLGCHFVGVLAFFIFGDRVLHVGGDSGDGILGELRKVFVGGGDGYSLNDRWG